MTNKEAGYRIGLIRSYRRWSQEQVARALNTTQTKVGNMENGRVKIQFEDMRLLAEALRFSLDAFVRHADGAFDLTACLLPWEDKGSE